MIDKINSVYEENLQKCKHMKEIDKKAFWDGIYNGHLNVHPTPTGNFPYMSIFKSPAGREYGRIVSGYEYAKNPLPDRFFVPDNQ